MKVSTTTKLLKGLVAKLQAEKQAFLDAIAEIDAIFGQFGVAIVGKKKRGRPRGSKGKRASKVMKRKTVRRKGKRGKFATTGAESILAFVRKAGKSGAPGSEIADHWKSEGRGQGVYPILGQLVKGKQLKRKKIKGERGSRFWAA